MTRRNTPTPERGDAAEPAATQATVGREAKSSTWSLRTNSEVVMLMCQRSKAAQTHRQSVRRSVLSSRTEPTLRFSPVSHFYPVVLGPESQGYWLKSTPTKWDARSRPSYVISSLYFTFHTSCAVKVEGEPLVRLKTSTATDICTESGTDPGWGWGVVSDPSPEA